MAGAAEGLGLGTLVPLVRSALASGRDALPVAGPVTPLETMTHSVLAALGIPETLGVLSAVLVAVLFVKAAVVLLAKRQVGYTVARVVTDMRLDLLSALLGARWGYFTRQPVGRITNAAGTEANRSAVAYANLAQTAQHGVMTLSYVAVALSLSWRLFLGAALGGALIWLGLQALVRFASRAGSEQTQLTNSLLSRLTDSLQSFRMLRSMGLEGLIAPLLDRDARDLKRAFRHQVLATETLTALQEPLLGVCVVLLMYYAVKALSMGAGEIFVLVWTFARGLQGSQRVQRKYQDTLINASAVWSMVELIESARHEAETHRGGRRPSLDSGIELRGITLAFSGRPVLDRLSLAIPAGCITAILGESGSGKTTLMDIITGLTPPDAGEVLVDGTPLAELDMACWRRMVGFVPQELGLLHESVRFNVTLGDPSLSDADVEYALRSAAAWDFVQENPEGLEASVGERGTLLSGGQRARIALARALVHRPKLLILDEATAALDPAAEEAVWQVLEKLRGETTIVAISHQPVLAGVADRIYRLEGGRARRVDSERRTG